MLFPIIIIIESAVHVVSLLAPLGLVAKTAFLAPFRMEQCKKRYFCRLPIMNYTIFMPQTFTDTFHVIVDTVSCIMHYGFDILADVFGNYSSIIRQKFQFLRNR